MYLKSLYLSGSRLYSSLRVFSSVYVQHHHDAPLADKKLFLLGTIPRPLCFILDATTSFHPTSSAFSFLRNRISTVLKQKHFFRFFSCCAHEKSVYAERRYGSLVFVGALMCRGPAAAQSHEHS